MHTFIIPILLCALSLTLVTISGGVTQAPEPATMLLFGTVMINLASITRRKIR